MEKQKTGNTVTQPDEHELTKVTLTIPTALHQSMKVRAIKERKPAQEVWIEAAELFLGTSQASAA